MVKRLPPPESLLLEAVEKGLTDPEFEPGAPIMAQVFQLQPRDQWQFTVDVIRKPDGKMVAVLVDARASIWDPEITPAERLNLMAKMLEESVEGMRATAQAVKT